MTSNEKTGSASRTQINISGKRGEDRTKTPDWGMVEFCTLRASTQFSSMYIYTFNTGINVNGKTLAVINAVPPLDRGSQQ